MTIAVDFDGTIVEHKFPAIGEEIPFATETLRMLIADRHKVILWSVREGELLEEAVKWCKDRGVDFYAVNKDYPEETEEHNNHFSRKLKADLFISGHVHVNVLEKRGNTVFLNPGSAALTKRPDGRNTVAVLADGTIRIFDIDTGDVLHELALDW